MNEHTVYSRRDCGIRFCKVHRSENHKLIVCNSGCNTSVISPYRPDQTFTLLISSPYQGTSSADRPSSPSGTQSHSSPTCRTCSIDYTHYLQHQYDGTQKSKRKHVPIQMVMKQKVHGPYPRDLKPIDRVPRVLLWTQQLFYLLNGEKALQPLVLVVLASEKPDVAVAGFVAALLHMSVCASDSKVVDVPFPRQCTREARAPSRRKTPTARDHSFRRTAVSLGIPSLPLAEAVPERSADQTYYAP